MAVVEAPTVSTDVVEGLRGVDGVDAVLSVPSDDGRGDGGGGA